MKRFENILCMAGGAPFAATALERAVLLVVMGTAGRTGVFGFINGNTAETIPNQFDCSVLAIKPPGFQTPVTVQEGTSDE